MSLKMFALSTASMILASMAWGQSVPVYEVDAQNGSVGNTNPAMPFVSITEAIAFGKSLALSEFDVEVIGLEDPSSPGVPYVYQQVNSFPAGGGEVFPIDVPAGVAVIASDTSQWPVVVGSASVSAASLFSMTASSSTSVVEIERRVEGLVLIGSEVGIQFNALTSGSGSVDSRVVIKDVTFAQNKKAVHASCSGASKLRNLTLRNCRLNSAIDASGFAPQVPEVGFHVTANGAGSICQAFVYVYSLVISGDFPVTGLDSAVIRIEGAGNVNWTGGGGGMQVNPLPHPVPNINTSMVFLSVDDSIIDGHKETGGWEFGIDASASGNTDPLKDGLRAGVGFRLEGTELRDFKLNGAALNVDSGAWGVAQLANEARISSTGDVNSVGPFEGAGLACGTRGGYIGVFAESGGSGQVSCHLADNRGAGLYLSAQSDRADFDTDLVGIPEGIYLELAEANIAKNFSHGVYAKATEAGVVGGTKSQHGPGAGDICFYGTSFPLADGQGMLENCRVNNNQIDGVHVDLWESVAIGEDAEGSASFAVVDSVIWNNIENGFEVRIRDIEEYHGKVLTPVFHSTIVDNGSESVVVTWPIPGPSFSSMPPLFRHDPCPNHTSKPPIRFVIWNSVLQRRFSSQVDFGGALVSNGSSVEPSLKVTEDPAGGSAGPEKVLCCGSRATLPNTQYFNDDLLALPSGSAFWTTSVVPFVGFGGAGTIPSSEDPYQYMLDTAASSYVSSFTESVDSAGGTRLRRMHQKYPMNSQLGGLVRDILSGQPVSSDNDKGASND